MKKIKQENASITLEACMVLTLFIFFILFLYSFFIVFEAQGKISSTMLRAGQSLSLDPVATENMVGDGLLPESVAQFVSRLGIFFNISNPKFTSTSKWYENETTAAENRRLKKVISDRFIAYLSNGDKDKADELLQELRVDGGWNGLDFSESKIDSQGNLVITVKYKLNYIFNYPMFNIEPISLKHSVKSHLWFKK